MNQLKRRSNRFRLIAPGAQMSEAVIGLILAVALAFGLIAGKEPTIARLAVGAAGGLLFFLIATSGRVTALQMVIVWLVFMGFIRRLLIPLAGWSPQDPLLLVGPGCAALIWLNGRGYQPKKRDAIAFFGALFVIWSFAQLLNPRSYSLMVDANGLLFWVPPLIWLFAGRTFPVSVHVKLTDLITVLTIPVTLLGLYHSSGRFLPFELTWVGVSGFGAAIFFEGFKIRPFSTLTSPQEYGAFLAVAIAFMWGSILARRPHLQWRVVLFVLSLIALFLQGTRHTFALVLFMCFLTTILWTKNYGLRMGLVAIAVAMVGIVSLKVLPEEYGDGPIATAMEHQISGFQNPGESTAPVHKQMIVDGFETAWENPLGLGLGRTTIAAAKVGQYSGGTEYDTSNVFVTFGIPAGVLFVVFLLIIFFTSVRRFRFCPTAHSIACLGILIAVFGNIWNGGLYTVSALVWLTIGSMTRPLEEMVPDSTPVEDLRLERAIPAQVAHAPA